MVRPLSHGYPLAVAYGVVGALGIVQGYSGGVLGAGVDIFGRQAAEGPTSLCPGLLATPAPVEYFIYPDSIIVGQPQCASPAPSCDESTCAGRFNDGKATCTTPNQAGCACNPSVNTLGYTCLSWTMQSCDANNCAGTFDNNGMATCKNAGRGCRCQPTTRIWYV
ncbi:hypothetical protein F4859DRAFT_344521 [Xylaria cf. heliscus]|nr:hypothetical protein F4859DRAFT_344521 [Xylaria cf. heliscus]